MVMTIILAAAMAAPAATSESFDFSRSYAIWAGSDHGRCQYFVTDAGESARQITDTLRRNYRAAAGIEVLTDRDTPIHCAADGVRAAKKAGFQHVRTRPGTEADRVPGIP